jgi:hypothetical protein
MIENGQMHKIWNKWMPRKPTGCNNFTSLSLGMDMVYSAFLMFVLAILVIFFILSLEYALKKADCKSYHS